MKGEYKQRLNESEGDVFTKYMSKLVWICSIFNNFIKTPHNSDVKA